jgi:hypothetical protein
LKSELTSRIAGSARMQLRSNEATALRASVSTSLDKNESGGVSPAALI